MKRSGRGEQSGLAASGLFFALMAGLFIVPAARAQTAAKPAVSSRVRVTIDYKNVPVRDAIDRLFHMGKAHYVLSDAVQGDVTVKAASVPFEEALRRLLKACHPPLTYTIEKGTYHIRPRPGAVAPAAEAVKPIPTPAPTPTPAAPSPETTRVTVDYHDAPIRDVLDRLFRQMHLNYSIDSEVTGTVTLKVTDMSFDDALRLILRSNSLPLTYSKDSGVYFIKPRAGFAPEP